VAEHKRKAGAEHDWFASQLEEVQQAIEGYRYVQRTRAKVGPIRDHPGADGGDHRLRMLLCQHPERQRLGRLGGRGPVVPLPGHLHPQCQEEKRKARVDDLEPEAPITGHYKFGANELSIHRALVRIVDMLEADYGLKIPREEP
jgi:hypothetical protein